MPQIGTKHEKAEPAQRNQVAVKLLPREIISENHPGHMGVIWSSRGKRKYRGFRFFLDDLPQESRDSSRWRSYLFENKVPGHVFDDIIIRDALEHFPQEVLCKEWDAQLDDTERLEIEGAVGRRGWYSFSPDSHSDCHNCVTWAISTVNRVLGEVLRPIPSGRIKLAIEMLRTLGATPSA